MDRPHAAAGHSSSPTLQLLARIYSPTVKSTSIPHPITSREKKERLEKPKDCPSRPKTVYVVPSKISSGMPSSAWPRSLIISSTSSFPTKSRTRFFRAKEISYTSFSLKCTKRKKKEMTDFSDTDINTIGFSHNCIRRTLGMSRHSLAVPDTVNIPPSQLAAWIETNLLYVVHVKNKRKEKRKETLTWS